MNWHAMTWHREPPRWEAQGPALSLVTARDTDFWRTTHYGFVRDNGHFLSAAVTGDFQAEVRFSAHYERQYDQAGLMLRLSEREWIKAGVEFEGGEQFLSVVVTRDRSDWSVRPLPPPGGEVRLRLGRVRGAVLVQCFLGGAWQLLRLTDFPEDEPAHIGPMACSPQGEGLSVTFHDFRVRPATTLDLH